MPDQVRQTLKSRVQEFWDTGHEEWVGGAPDPYWTSQPLINAYVNLQIAGGINRSTLSWLAEDIFSDLRPLSCIASVACGAGAAERQALVTGLAAAVHGYDYSESSLDTARHLASADGCADRTLYRQYDFNSEPIPSNGQDYPLIICFGGLHHVERLDFALGEIKSRLEPGGIVFFNEYVGPNRFQYHESHLETLNSVIQSVPKAFRNMDTFTPIDESMLENTDPSEAVRSEEIMPAVEKQFHILDRCDYGGGILFPLWSDVLIREKLSTEAQIRGVPVLQELIALEEELTAAGKLPSLFSQCLICRPEDAEKLGFVIERARGDARTTRPSEALESLDMATLPWPVREEKKNGGLGGFYRAVASRVLGG